jgi:hypothetical protein
MVYPFLEHLCKPKTFARAGDKQESVAMTLLFTIIVIIMSLLERASFRPRYIFLALRNPKATLHDMFS